MKHPSKAKLLALALSCLLSLGLVEGVLRFAGKRMGLSFPLPNELLHDQLLAYEAVPSRLDTPRDYPLDRKLGWREYGPAYDTAGVQCTRNSQRWRSKHEYVRDKTKPRVLVVGDSFINWCGVDDEDLVTTHLQSLLGPGVEVMNMGAPGFGVDQMAMVIDAEAPIYRPDVVVLAFIRDDLRRSCTPMFQDYFRKPYYRLEDGVLALHGVPVRTDREVYEAAARGPFWNRVGNAALSWSLRPRVVRALANIYLEMQVDRCQTELNLAILEHAATTLPEGSRLLVAYLDGGELPDGFARDLTRLDPLRFVDVSAQTTRLSAELGLSLERLQDGHPAGSFNRVYAHALAAEIRTMLGRGAAVAAH